MYILDLVSYLCVVFVFICLYNVVIAFGLSFVTGGSVFTYLFIEGKKNIKNKTKTETDKQKATKYKNKLWGDIHEKFGQFNYMRTIGW